MDQVTATIVIGVPLVVGLPILITVLINIVLEKLNSRRAFKRLQNDPRFKQNSPITELIDVESGRTLMTECYLDDLSSGFIVIRSNDKKRQMSFTGEEFKSIRPVFAKKG